MNVYNFCRKPVYVVINGIGRTATNVKYPKKQRYEQNGAQVESELPRFRGIARLLREPLGAVDGAAANHSFFSKS